MAGVKKDPNKQYSSNWGGKREGAGRISDKELSFKYLSDKMLEKHKVDPHEVLAIIMKESSKGSDVHSQKVALEAVKTAFQYSYAKPTEDKADTNVNVIVANNTAELDEMIARELAELKSLEGEVENDGI